MKFVALEWYDIEGKGGLSATTRKTMEDNINISAAVDTGTAISML